MNKDKVTNKELYKQIQKYALSSYFYSRKAYSYFAIEYYTYAPMIKGELFASHFAQEDIVGVEDMERALGRRIKVDELEVCPLSTGYFLFGHPTIEETDEARDTLIKFRELIEAQIGRAENRTRNYILKDLQR